MELPVKMRESGHRRQLEYTVKTENLLARPWMATGYSRRFDVYGVDFGWGKAAAVRSRFDNKFTGLIIAFPGRDGGVELEICLPEVTRGPLVADLVFVEAMLP